MYITVPGEMRAVRMRVSTFPGATHRDGDSAAPREKQRLYSITAYRAISPPMELPAMKVSFRPGRVGNSSSMAGLKLRTSHSMVVLPRPPTRPRSPAENVQGEYSDSRPLSG